MNLCTLVDTSRRIGETSRRLEKIRLLADFLCRLAPEEIPIAASYLSGNLRQGRIGIGYSVLRESNPSDSECTMPPTLAEVDGAFERIASVTGPGSAGIRLRLIQDLFSRTNREESNFLSRLIMGELRQGSLEGIMIEALARAAEVPDILGGLSEHGLEWVRLWWKWPSMKSSQVRTTLQGLLYDSRESGDTGPTRAPKRLIRAAASAPC